MTDFILLAAFFVSVMRWSLGRKSWPQKAGEALSLLAANVLSLQYEVERPKLQVKRVRPQCVLLSDMPVMQQREVCAINECDLKTVCYKSKQEHGEAFHLGVSSCRERLQRPHFICKFAAVWGAGCIVVTLTCVMELLWSHAPQHKYWVVSAQQESKLLLKTGSDC